MFRRAILSFVFFSIPLWHAKAANIRSHLAHVEEQQRSLAWVQCAVEDVLGANQTLHNKEALCVNGQPYFYNHFCDLHYEAYPTNGTCHKELVDSAGDDCHLHMQNDGNLVFYDGLKNPLWSSHTKGENATVYVDTAFDQLLIQVPVLEQGTPEVAKAGVQNISVPVDQGQRKLVVDQTELIDCKVNELQRGTTLKSTEYVCDDTNNTGAFLGIDSAGCLVSGTVLSDIVGNVTTTQTITERISTKCCWSAYLQIHSDGNLVMYDKNVEVLWESDTRGGNSSVSFDPITNMPYIYTPVYSC